MELRKKDGMIMEEKKARMKVEQAVQTCVERLMDVEDRLKHVENSSRENKNALAQLISHTKNVERAVTMNQQDLMQRKEAQATKYIIYRVFSTYCVIKINLFEIDMNEKAKMAEKAEMVEKP